VSADALELRAKLGDYWQPSDAWLWIEPELVSPRILVPTQNPHYWPCKITRHRVGGPVEGGDRYPHVIDWRSRLFIWDGHTRVARWLKEQAYLVLVRVWEIW
jgi:hypothetical protein